MSQAGSQAARRLWEQTRGPDSHSAAAALASLAASHQLPSSPEQVAQLLDAARPGSAPALALPALALLARWARQAALQPAAARDAALLQRATGAARSLLDAAVGQPHLASACLLLLASTAVTAPEEAAAAADAAEAVGAALLGPQLQAALVEPELAAEVTSAVGALLPCLVDQPDVACRLLGDLLRWLGGAADDGALPSCLALDCLAPAYPMMRGAAVAALRRSPPSVAVPRLLAPAYAVLRDAARCGPAAAPAPQAAAAVLAAGGLAEALLRSAAGYAEAAQLAAEAQGVLVSPCEAAEAAGAAAAPASSPPRLALLRDACALAGAQLGAAVRLPQLAAGSLVRCQAQALLHSALSLAPLADAALAGGPPAQASEQLRRQAGCALSQQAATLSSSLAAAYPLQDGGTQGWLLQQVAGAARRAHDDYRRVTLGAPAGWLAALAAAALRQLLDRLFLACLGLLSAAWAAPPAAAAPAAAAAAAAGRAQLAAAVLGALADLQFCRVGAAQHAALLRGVLSELPGDGAAAAALAAGLPCYADLARPAPSGGQPVWLIDGVSAAKVQLMFNALVPCCGVLPQLTLEERLAPMAFLYMLHPHSPLAAAAHTLLCALLLAVPEPAREPLAAFYVRRALEGVPGATPLPQFGQGLATVLQALPLGSPVAVACLQSVLDRCQELAAWGDPSVPGLAALAAQSLLLVDHSLLGGALAACDRLLRPHSPGAAAEPGAAPAAAALRGAALAAVRASDDCVRKPALSRWLLECSGGP